MKFAKLEAVGNDFIVIEDFNNKFKGNESSFSKKICDRHFGVGADGVLFVRDTDKADIEMCIINKDGSYATMCGNGIRCFAKYVYEKRIVRKDKMKILTGDGVKPVKLEIINNNIKEIKVNMGAGDFDPKSIPANSDKPIIDNILKIGNDNVRITSLLLGVPHTVIFDDFDLKKAQYIEKHKLFLEGTNVNFCRVIDRENIELRTYERGAGETLACGTGSCAAALVAYKKGYVNSDINIKLLGGMIKTELRDDIIFMVGNANFICEGIYLGER